MQPQTPLPLVPGSWDEIVARGALKLADWLHDRLSRREPTLAAMPLPPDPARRLLARGSVIRGRDTNHAPAERAGRDRP